jgi:hypothetical protein
MPEVNEIGTNPFPRPAPEGFEVSWSRDTQTLDLCNLETVCTTGGSSIDFSKQC